MIWSWEVTISERYIVGITKACTKGLAPPRDNKLKKQKKMDIFDVSSGHYVQRVGKRSTPPLSMDTICLYSQFR